MHSQNVQHAKVLNVYQALSIQSIHIPNQMELWHYVVQPASVFGRGYELVTSCHDSIRICSLRTFILRQVIPLACSLHIWWLRHPGHDCEWLLCEQSSVDSGEQSTDLLRNNLLQQVTSLLWFIITEYYQDRRSTLLRVLSSPEWNIGINTTPAE